MRVIIKDDKELVADWAANYVAYKINRFKPTPSKPFVLGLPTGSTPLGMYNKLIKLYQEGKVSFANVVTFNLSLSITKSASYPGAITPKLSCLIILAGLVEAI